MKDIISTDAEKCVAYQARSKKWYELDENNNQVISKDMNLMEVKGTKGDGWVVFYCDSCSEYSSRRTINNGAGCKHPRTQCINSGMQQTFSKSSFLTLISGPYHQKKRAEEIMEQIDNATTSDSGSESADGESPKEDKRCVEENQDNVESSGTN